MSFKLTTLSLLLAVILAACSNGSNSNSTTAAPSALSQIAAARLNFRYEGDVPGPGDQPAENQVEERNAGIQADFDQNRPEEILDRTISSPDKKRVLAL